MPSLRHPNVVQIEGISSPASLTHFIAYEGAHWKNAEGPLAVALRDELQTSITLGLKMIAGLSAGMSFLSLHGVLSLGSMGVDNFVIFLDVDDRFVISIDPRQSEEMDTTTEYEDPEENIWMLFNALCRKTLISANRLLHDKEISRDPAPDLLFRSSVDVYDQFPATSELPLESTAVSQNAPGEVAPALPRREFVWRAMDRGRQSLETVARRITLDLDGNFPRLRRLTWSHDWNPHRCPGYVREEITLTTSTLDSAVVAHDAPSPLEICSICHEVVDLDEKFRCVCGDPAPGSRHTIKCLECKLWSHSDCAGNPKEFICQLCVGFAMEIDTDGSDASDDLDAMPLETVSKRDEERAVNSLRMDSGLSPLSTVSLLPGLSNTAMEIDTDGSDASDDLDAMLLETVSKRDEERAVNSLRMDSGPPPLGTILPSFQSDGVPFFSNAVRNKRRAEDAFGQDEWQLEQNVDGIQDVANKLMAHMLGLDIPGVEPSTSFYTGSDRWARPDSAQQPMPPQSWQQTVSGQSSSANPEFAVVP
ncbi:hypothetical protein B0H14DRAFT_3505677 [Mycena olivaceomarginata]|nr:hypothetical protein B0H14DRAFT_3505677 [Mycena olivaceomarginata]